jgi:hypothetical protein
VEEPKQHDQTNQNATFEEEEEEEDKLILLSLLHHTTLEELTSYLRASVLPSID